MRCLLPLLFLAAACSQESGDATSPSSQDAALTPDAAPAATDLLWDAPEFPQGSSMNIDGEAVSDWNLNEFLVDEWTQYAATLDAQPADVDRLVAEFLVAPGKLFAPLVRDWLLLREHKERHPGPVDEHDFQHWTEGLGPQAGAAATQIEQRLGKERFREHLENQFRIRKMLVEFQTSIGQITEADIQTEFERRQQRLRDSGEYSDEELANMPGLDEGNLRLAIESQLATEMAERGVDEWLTELLPVTVVEFTDPTGKSRVLDVPVQFQE